MTFAVSAKDDMLFVEVDNVWKRIGEIKNIPEIGETAEKIDVTTLDSEMHEYIKDIPDMAAELEFTCNAQPVGTPNGNLDLIMSMSRNAAYRWKWVSPRLGIQAIITGDWAHKIGVGAVSTPRDLIITIIPRTRPIISEISASYTVTYDNNGGSGEMTDASSPYDNGATVTTKANTFTAPDGQKFVQWNTAADATGDAYDQGDTFKIYKDTTLYAIWSD